MKGHAMSRLARTLTVLGALLAVGVTTASLTVLPTGCTSTASIDTSAMSFSSSPLVGKVVWNDLVTDDLEAARRFYGELFGWTFEQSEGRAHRPYVVARSGRVYVAGIVQAAPHSSDTTWSRWLPYVSVDDVDDSVAKATAAGGDVAVDPQHVGFGRAAVIIDNEGAVIGLARSRVGDPDDVTTAPAAGRVVWTELLANDPASEARFYETVIGYAVRTIERRGGDYRLLTHNGSNRAGILRNPSEQAAPVWLTYFGVDDPAAAARRVTALGGKVLLPPSAQLRDGTMTVVTDPTGALLVLQKLTR
jgi:predicted enzyme related to lactoylglutathione lyase